jgi:hypothetical protein
MTPQTSQTVPEIPGSRIGQKQEEVGEEREEEELQEFRSSGVQEFRSSGVQEFRSSGVQEFRRKLNLLKDCMQLILDLLLK